jgi:serine protease Do
VTATLGDSGEQRAASAQTGEVAGGALKGVEVQNLTPALASQLGLPSTAEAAVVISVDPSSTAADADLERGDVIMEVDHRRVHNLNEYNQAIAGAGRQPVLLLVNRRGTTHYIVVQP